MPENNRPVSRPRHGPHGPHGPGGPPMEKAKDFKGTLRKLLTYVKPFKAACAEKGAQFSYRGHQSKHYVR